MPLKIKFDEYRLDNGMRVILHQDDSVPIVTINIWYHVGSKNEKKGKTGFAHLFEHMMFQGSEHVADNMHFRLIQSAGGTLNGSTFFDRTNYYETLPSHFLEMGLWLESDRVGFLLPAMTQEKLDNQRDVVKNERRQHVDNQPYGLWLEKMLELAYPKDFPYHWPIIGYMEDIDAARLEDVSRFFQTYYAPNNASLIIAGDFDPEKVRQLIDKYFGSIKKGNIIPPISTKFNNYHSGEKRTVIKDRVQLPRIYMAYHIPAYGTKESYTTEIMSDILSEGKSARLYQSLIYKKQIAQDAHALMLNMQETSLLIFLVTAKPGVSVDKLEKELQIEIDRMINEPVSEYELQRIINQIEARKIRELQSVNSKADLLNLFAVYFDDPDLINHEIERYKSIGAADIKKTAGNYLNNDNRVVVTFLPEK
ncbi:MAG: insulinase family protein [Calditrichales bacterium]|nr:insulinase family protein [Calditrichales bacterium]